MITRVGMVVLEILGVVWRWIREHLVLAVAALVALISCFLVPPDSAYLGYMDLKTLACLFCILAVAQALRRLGAFERAAGSLVRRFHRPRSAVGALVGATAVVSMFATNDMALIMMLPLSTATLLRGGWTPLIPRIFVLQGLAANLCGMVMPFGNPQNLYLYSWYHLGLGEFLRVMATPFLCSTLLVVACAVVLIPREVTGGAPNADAGSNTGGPSLMKTAVNAAPTALDPKRLGVYLGLLAVAIATVFHLIPWWVACVVVAGALLVLDREALKRVDWYLLLTFVCFFVFAGNMARVPQAATVLTSLLEGRELWISAALSQVISNVPAAVLLSRFTTDWAGILMGVNIGGAGTLVGSLASLITLQHYLSLRKTAALAPWADNALSVGRFMVPFTLLNLGFLAVLLGVCGWVFPG